MKRRTFITHLLTGLGAATLGVKTSLPVFSAVKHYLTEEQALKIIFPRSGKVLQETQQLNDDQLKSIENTLHLRLNSRSHTFYRGETNNNTDGYAMVLNEIGKEQFITFIVGIGPNFKVQRVALMVFRETRGWEVDDARFTDQFKGKTSKNSIMIGSDIIGVTGATLSSRAFCRGIKKALALCEVSYKK